MYNDYSRDEVGGEANVSDPVVPRGVRGNDPFVADAEAGGRGAPAVSRQDANEDEKEREREGDVVIYYIKYKSHTRAPDINVRVTNSSRTLQSRILRYQTAATRDFGQSSLRRRDDNVDNDDDGDR